MSAATRFPRPGYAKTLAAALSGAGAAVWLRLPLPWFTGPLIVVAAANMLGARLPSPPHARDGGQWIIGTALGLYFTPEVVRALAQLAPWVGLTTLAMIALGLVAAWVLKRATGESGATTFFAMAIGGASEMAAQAERYGGRVDRVAAAHSLRIVLVALIVPFALQWAGVQGTDPYRPAAQDFDPVGLVVLAAATGGGAIALSRLHVPNVWMIGPLVVAGALSAGGHAFSSLPRAVVDAGQLLIGVALGSRFSTGFFRVAPRYLTAVALITLGLLGMAALYGWWLARHAGRDRRDGDHREGARARRAGRRGLSHRSPDRAGAGGGRPVPRRAPRGSATPAMRALAPGGVGAFRPARRVSPASAPGRVPLARGGSAALATGFFAGRGVRWQRSRFCAVVVLRNQCSPGPSHARFAVPGAASSHCPGSVWQSLSQQCPHPTSRLRAAGASRVFFE